MRPVRPGPCDDYVTGMTRCPQVEVRLVSMSSSPGCLGEAVFNCVCLTWHYFLSLVFSSFTLFSCPSPSGVVCKSRICGTCEQFLAINCGVQDRELLLATQDVFSALFYSQSPSPSLSLCLSLCGTRRHAVWHGLWGVWMQSGVRHKPNIHPNWRSICASRPTPICMHAMLLTRPRSRISAQWAMGKGNWR